MWGVCLNYLQKNYGSKLQALATVKTFEELGLEYEIIRYNKKTLRFILKYLLRCFNIVFIHDRYDQIQKTLSMRKHPQVKAAVDRRNSAFDAFDGHFADHLSGVYNSYEDLKKQCPGRYEGVMVCSDQLWSPSALGSGFYNLMFAPEEMPKASWAASFGVSEIPWYQKNRTKQYLLRIQNISMRENRGSEIVRELTGREVRVLMDPVFALTKQEWDVLIPVTKPEWDNYMFCYFLGDNPEHRIKAQKYAEEKNLKIVTLRHLDRYVPEDERFGDYAPYDVDPNRFLNILRHAECICTDSFHGSAFSVIFEKEFVVFDRYSSSSTNSKNSRIDSLCNNLNLNDRRVRSKDEIRSIMQNKICYEEVMERIEKYRRDTWLYLKKVFNDGIEYGSY